MAAQEKQLEEVKQRYAPVFRVIEQTGVRLSHVHMQNGKMYVQGSAPSTESKNKVWDQIKLVNPNLDDATFDISVSEQETASHGEKTYTVQAGDSLSKISQRFYGHANDYMKIFDANKDKLSDPNRIHPGQVLTIPK